MYMTISYITCVLDMSLYIMYIIAFKAVSTNRIKHRHVVLKPQQTTTNSHQL